MTSFRKRGLPLTLFILVFGGLLILASFFDLQVSQILTKGSLIPGEYYSVNIIGRIIEAMGSWPIYLCIALFFMIIGHYFDFKETKIKYLSILFDILAVAAFTYLTYDTIHYIVKFYDASALMKKFWMLGLCLTGGLVLGIPSVFFYHKVSKEQNDKMMRFAIVILCAVAGYLVVTFIKGPIGRMRFRAMNTIDDYSYFTPWYVVSHARTLVSAEDLALLPVTEVKDAFKSFPSGHTYSAGTSYVIIALPYVIDKFNNKKGKILCYLIPVIYTGLVALFRIVHGAHYFSDVLVGGTLAFVFAETGKFLVFEKQWKKKA